jgi:hypothetical protein
MDRVKTELSGAGPRPLDADQREYCHLYLLEIVKPYGQWMVLGRTGGGVGNIMFRDLGLDPALDYHVFEFWSKRYLGAFHDEFKVGDINPEYGCQLFCIRQKSSEPQVIATNRHITCGGYDLENLSWNSGKLNGTSKVVRSDMYEIYIFEPQNFAAKNVSATGGKVIENVMSGGLRKITIQPGDSATLSWEIIY